MVPSEKRNSAVSERKKAESLEEARKIEELNMSVDVCGSKYMTDPKLDATSLQWVPTNEALESKAPPDDGTHIEPPLMLALEAVNEQSSAVINGAVMSPAFPSAEF
mmetsp:Transcript_15180/g.30730  ORF Transcript_15180/g.30730 Transcript_15180/m.30730 type:complete len:106 (-) Transcript_15180:5052-5369(-)